MIHDLHFRDALPFDSGSLVVDSGHSLHWEQFGQPTGQPIVLLHGGPGAGIDRQLQRLVDARHYRIVAFDQRGCGLSTPHGELRNNTTGHLVDDIESLRRHLAIEGWLVAGGSWGSSLALAYATRFPERVAGLILRGVFLCREAERRWYLHGLKTIFPEAWERFTGYLPEAERDDPVAAFAERLNAPDLQQRTEAATVWCEYEARCSTLLPDTGMIDPALATRTVTLARIQTHYFSNAFFLDETALLDGVDRIRSIPGVIIQGRYDMICPIISAHELHLAWPQAEFKVVDNAGHAACEPGTRRAFVAATERFKIS